MQMFMDSELCIRIALIMNGIKGGSVTCFSIPSDDKGWVGYMF